MKEATENPSEILATLPSQPKREETVKVLMDKYPGHIAWATDRANFAGCRVIRFGYGRAEGLTAEDYENLKLQAKSAELKMQDGQVYQTCSPEELMNLYFSHRANLLVVQMGYDSGEICCFITTQLDEEDLEDFEAVRQANQVAMREATAKRHERHVEKRKAEQEEKRLAEVGRKYEANLKHNIPKELA